MRKKETNFLRPIKDDKTLIEKVDHKFKAFIANKTGQVPGISLIPTLVLGLVIGFVTLSVGSNIMQNVRDGETTNSAAWNSSNAGLDAMLEFGDFGSTMGLIGAAVVVLSLLAVGLGALVFRGR